MWHLRPSHRQWKQPSPEELELTVQEGVNNYDCSSFPVPECKPMYLITSHQGGDLTSKRRKLKKYLGGGGTEKH